MECIEIQDNLSAYLDNELEANEKQQIERHLHQCPACSGELRQLHMVCAAVSALPIVVPPPQFRQNLQARLATSAVLPSEAIAPNLTPWWSRMRVHSKTAIRSATTVACALLVLVLARNFAPPSNPSPSAPNQQVSFSISQDAGHVASLNRKSSPQKNDQKHQQSINLLTGAATSSAPKTKSVSCEEAVSRKTSSTPAAKTTPTMDVQAINGADFATAGQSSSEVSSTNSLTKAAVQKRPTTASRGMGPSLIGHNEPSQPSVTAPSTPQMASTFSASADAASSTPSPRVLAQIAADSTEGSTDITPKAVAKKDSPSIQSATVPVNDVAPLAPERGTVHYVGNADLFFSAIQLLVQEIGGTWAQENATARATIPQTQLDAFLTRITEEHPNAKVTKTESLETATSSGSNAYSVTVTFTVDELGK